MTLARANNVKCPMKAKQAKNSKLKQQNKDNSNRKT
jgi:hypothetical protein